MPRPLRLEYPGALYHVLNRGDRREAIFKDDRDRQSFLLTLGEVCAKTDWQVHAYCLMENHFHLVLETPRPNLVAGMKWFLGTYTTRFNRRHQLFGHLFSGRYKSLIVDGSGDGYLRTVCEYVHLNPARAQLLGPDQKLADYPWSSITEYLKAPRRRASWMRVDRLLGEYHIPKDTVAGRREFERRLEERRHQQSGREWKTIRRGWCVGEEAFRKELLAQAHERLGEAHYGRQRQESSEEKALRIVAEEMKRRRWTRQHLKERAKGDMEKVLMAYRLRQETTMTLKWIAQRLEMGSWTYVSNCLAQHKTSEGRS